MVNIDGLISGIDTEVIVQGLLEIQQQQVDRIELKRADVLTRQAVFSGLEAVMTTLRADIGRLARVQNSPLSGNIVSVSDETALSAQASSSAVPGVYRMTVDNVARAHQVATQGYADLDAAVAEGTLEVRVGSGDLTTITIDSSNNTLQGLADSINDSKAGVHASIIQDANGGATPYRLLLTSDETGTDHQLTINNNLTGGSGTQPAFDLGNPVQAATDAQVTLGSGAGAISVQSSNNRFENLIAGVTIDLLNATDGSEVTVTVAQDTETAVDAVESFVNSFNGVLSFIDERSKYDAAAEQGGLLLGNRAAQSIEQSLRSAAVSVVGGVNSDVNRLSAIGISVTDQGTLQLDRSRLESVLKGNVDGVETADVKRLFALDAQSSSSGMRFVLGSARTKASGGNSYEVDITQAAERATITGGTALAASTVIDSSNRTLDMELDGVTATITLNEGTYTEQELADHVEDVINGSSSFIGRSVRVSLIGSQMQITSNTYGKSSSLLLSGGTALGTLGFTAGTADVGRDVAGTFIVNGVHESATGNGQLLVGNAENENTGDLQIRVTLKPAEVVSGIEGEFSVTRGLAASMDQILNDILDPVDGRLATIDDSFDQELASLQTALDRQQALFDRQQERLIREFTALESALADLQSTSQFIAAQFGGGAFS